MTNKFEVVIFNRGARRLVGEGRHHRQLDDSWAENQHVEIRAADAEDARRRIERRYPTNQGYEVVEVTSIQEYG